MDAIQFLSPDKRNFKRKVLISHFCVDRTDGEFNKKRLDEIF
jgi:hypothetical protein